MNIAKKFCSRRELLDRWRGVEEEDNSISLLPSEQARIRHLKEQWFSDAFSFLICLEKDTHIWCGSWDLMGPLLETFYNYFKDDRDDSPLKVLWRRISKEMRQCTQCICQHHQAQEMYQAEYESSCIGPLLNVIRTLDEERVTQHLKEINARIARGEIDSESNSAEVASLMFEVLMFPVLLDDLSLVTEFQSFIEAIDDTHELTLAGHQQYSGVYALLFLKSRRVRSIGLRLAGCNGKLRRAADLEPLQPLLKKCIGYLETEVLPPASETSRPRVQLERINIWIGIKTLLGFLEPSTFEEGILERYPIFLSIVLNHVSDDSLEFTHAANCLRLLFEMLGCKLWLRTTLSPSVMRNTLMGQCFHSRNEKSHKEIFDLFQPFLQSLEALQDGEHEKQRRNILYFLLHQVKMSSNFSVLMRKKACQIALLIIHRGYKMNPPCPPFECAHMWGPSLVCSLRDSSLHDSLRQPAFDLIHTILVSDSAALIVSLRCYTLQNVDSIPADLSDDEDELTFSYDVEEKDNSCWSDFSVQGKLAARECRGWLCIPMLWFDVLVETNLTVFPISFYKAALWALSRFSMIEFESNLEMELPIRDWLSSSAGKISFMWEVPTGSDDGGDGNVSKNSVEASSMCIPLVKIFKRLTAQFVIQMEHGKLWKQWTWEPRMAESVILLLVDPNDNVRQVDRLILEHVSQTRGLSLGLQFLCSTGSSLSAIYFGLMHALKLVQLDCVLLKFQRLHHLFFVLCKLFNEMVPSHKSPGSKVENPNFTSEGGFLWQPVFSASQTELDNLPIVVDQESWERFSYLLSELSWPTLTKCLAAGKGYINDKNSQISCIRLLEIIPVVFGRLCSSFRKPSGTDISIFDLKWLHDFVDWGKSSQVTVTRYWKQALSVLVDSLNNSCHHGCTSIYRSIQKIISCDDVAVDDLKEQISELFVLLSRKVCISSSKEEHSILKDSSVASKRRSGLKTENLPFENAELQVLEDSPFASKRPDLKTEPSCFEDADLQVFDSLSVDKSKDKVLAKSNDSVENESYSKVTVRSGTGISDLLKESKLDSGVGEMKLSNDNGKRSFPYIGTSVNISEAIQKHEYDVTEGQPAPVNTAQWTGVGDTKEEMKHDGNTIDATLPPHKDYNIQKSSSNRHVGFKTSCHEYSSLTSGASANARTRDTILKELVYDIENDPLEQALKSSKRLQSLQTKPGPPVPKRQVIQLSVPGESKIGTRKLNAGGKSLKPPRLDDWYRPILEMDYFSAVGLSSSNEDEKLTATKLKEVPVCFESLDHYVDVFRPLVLEEFKAQLHSSFLESSSLEEMCCGSISVLSIERVDDFHLVRCVSSENESEASKGCSENDLVLLTKNSLQNSIPDVHVIGKVERRDKDSKKRLSILVIRFYLQNSSLRLNKAKRFLIERSKWYISRIMSITPQLREFRALSSLKDIPMLPVILKPTVHRRGDFESSRIEMCKLSQPLQRTFKASFNDSQLLAVSVAIGTYSSRKDFELSLIQGPPGTGKTRTILAIVSGLLSLSSQQKKDADKYQNCNSKLSKISSNSRVPISQSAAIARAWQDAAYARQLNEDGAKNTNLVDNSSGVRILLCAQSNAAVDELVSRISSEGLYGNDGKSYKPYLVRVGNAKTVHPSSLPFFIDTLVDQRLAEEKMNECDPKNDLSVENSTKLRSNLENIVDRIRFYESKRANIRDRNSDTKCSSEDKACEDDDSTDLSDAAIAVKLNKLYQQKREICKDLAIAQAREKKHSEESKALKHKLRKTILMEAEIVVTTLSGSGGDLYGVCAESLANYKFGNPSEHTLFDAVVIDEAAQALEPATLIPLQLLKSSRTKCIMVGDPKQLPATVLSHVASKYLYACSMFERLQRAGYPVVMLAKQYRMHPEICKFPSLHFYDNKLLNGDDMISKVARFHENKYLGPYIFFDVVDGQESHGKNSGAMSLYNECEASVVVEVLRFFSKRYASEFSGRRIGIISPYKSQVSLLRSRVASIFGPSAIADMEFNTVDGFQGREVDILILSTVRASVLSVTTESKSSIIGFVADVRRMNVALTRAKLSLWIIGNVKTLQTNQNWAALIKNAKHRNMVKTMCRPYESMFKKSSSVSRRKEVFTESDSKTDRKLKNASKFLDQTGGCENEMNEKTNIVNGVTSHKCRSGINEKHNKEVNKDVSPDGPSKDVRPCTRTKHARNDLGKGRDISRKHATLSNKSGSASTGGAISVNSETRIKPSHILQGRESNPSKGLEGSSESIKQSKLGGQVSCTQDTSEEQEGNAVCTNICTKSASQDLVTIRKQQREAVDALLPSALLSSKKPETTSKSKFMKRPLSPNAKAAIKRPKQRKG